jgi:hypothetical protein
MRAAVGGRRERLSRVGSGRRWHRDRPALAALRPHGGKRSGSHGVIVAQMPAAARASRAQRRPRAVPWAMSAAVPVFPLQGVAARCGPGCRPSAVARRHANNPGVAAAARRLPTPTPSPTGAPSSEITPAASPTALAIVVDGGSGGTGVIPGRGNEREDGRDRVLAGRDVGPGHRAGRSPSTRYAVETFDGAAQAFVIASNTRSCRVLEPGFCARGCAGRVSETRRAARPVLLRVGHAARRRRAVERHVVSPVSARRRAGGIGFGRLALEATGASSMPAAARGA